MDNLKNKTQKDLHQRQAELQTLGSAIGGAGAALPASVEEEYRMIQRELERRKGERGQ